MPLRTVPWLNQSRQGHHGKYCSNCGTYAGRARAGLSLDTNAYILTVRVPGDMFRVTVQRRTTRIRCASLSYLNCFILWRGGGCEIG
jgi:hypothetical protein